ncbi:MAG: hypothetical protein H0T89_17115 [Deltaproteobacteria bacterium]|nr:hypothetical protein [Deltaproteobacteria bacterium]MDQ3294974.1 hypothetical protein [Myxococcota bacterium]
MRGLSWKISRDGERSVVQLKGSIDETAGFVDLVDELGATRTIRLDLGGVQRINSSGVREWITFIRKLPPGSPVELERCTPVLVSQLNVINRFAGDARVLSVYAPFVCPHCKHEENVLLDVGAGRSKLSLGSVKCSSCRKPSEFDDVEDAYFAFLDPDAER